MDYQRLGQSQGQLQRRQRAFTAVADRFQRLIDSIQPKAESTLRAGVHAATIKTRLEKSFGVKIAFPIGSYARGTRIAYVSDVDLFAVLPRSQVRRGDAWLQSNTVLDHLRDEMLDRYPNTPVYRDVQAIVVKFGDCSVDVVPAFFLRHDQWPIYAMPDGAGGWMKTSPGWHKSYLQRANFVSGGKLRRTAQLMKFWRACRIPAVPISSFHIEMALAKEAICNGVKSYATCVMDILQSMAERECRGFSDPLGVSGLIRCVKSEAQRANALKVVRYSRDHAQSALEAAIDGDTQEALRQWDIVFNNEFPR